MADINDFKLLGQKCLSQFNLANVNTNFDVDKIKKLSSIEKERFGFYYLIIQQTSDIEEYSEITDVICDTDFNSKLFDNKDSDEGIDAVYINEDKKEIILYNFKYRTKFSSDKKQSENDVMISNKFFSAIETENTSKLKGQIKNYADKIIECNNSNDVWKTCFYIVSNESQTLSINDSNIKNLAKIYGYEIKAIGLTEVLNYMSIRPEKVNAILFLSKENIMSFEEDPLSTDKSYIVNLPLTELIRITCDDKEIRNKYSIEDEKILCNVNLNYNVLFENVRGYITKSKFNSNIVKTLNDDPSNFFFYNNGITIVADDIGSELLNSNKKFKINISNFQVLNGGQTLRTIHSYNKQNDINIIDKLSTAHVLVKIFKVKDPDLKNKIGEYTNSQNVINLVNLKSIRTEQIHLEEYLKEFNILYVRKKGDTGPIDVKYDLSIGIERLGQILLATTKGKPEEISNKKREIFNSYYDELFTENNDLISERTVELIQRYKYIEDNYKKSEFKKSEQKKMYILYISEKLNIYNYEGIITKFEEYVLKFQKDESTEKAVARSLITVEFRNYIDKKFKITHS